MTSYRLDFDSEGNLGIYHKSGGSQPDLWIGEILEPESPNPVLVLGIPVGILGVQRILDVFKKWQVAHGPTSGKRQPAPRSAIYRPPSRKWRKANRAGK